MSMPQSTAPLIVYIVWHQDFKEGQAIADHLYSSFSRDSRQPLERGLGIPVFFRSIVDSNGFIKPIDFTESDKTVIVVLIDNELMLASETWRSYVGAIADFCKKPGSGAYLIPISLTETATSYRPVGNHNAIRVHALKPDVSISDDKEREQELIERRLDELRRRLLYQLCWLCGITPSEAEIPGIASSHPQLFLSHAKLDGEVYTQKIRDYINYNTILKGFFDVVDIGYGRDFETALKHHAAHSAALVVFLTDAYSSREWCRIEVLTAKRNYCPIVVVNAIEKGERRSFPYLGNVPTIRWDGNNADEVVELAMNQVLYNVHSKLLLRKQSDMYGHPDRYLLSNSPELFDLVHLKRLMEEDDVDNCVVLYPEPPLGTEELLLLTDSESKIVFITPAFLPILLPISK